MEKHAKRKEKKEEGKGGVTQKEGWVAPGRRVDEAKKPAAEPAAATDAAATSESDAAAAAAAAAATGTTCPFTTPSPQIICMYKMPADTKPRSRRPKRPST